MKRSRLSTGKTMGRYQSRPRAYVADDLDEGDYPLVPEIQVSENVAVDTGLLDSLGNSIWRNPFPVGFGRDDEW